MLNLNDWLVLLELSELMDHVMMILPVDSDHSDVLVLSENVFECLETVKFEGPYIVLCHWEHIVQEDIMYADTFPFQVKEFFLNPLLELL